MYTALLGYGKKYICKLGTALIYVISFIILQQILFVAVYNSLVIPVYVLFDASFVIVFCAVIFLCPQKIGIVIGGFLIIIQACLNITVITVYNNTGMVFHFSHIALAEEAGAGLSPGMFPFWTIAFMSLIFALYLTAACLLAWFLRNKDKDQKAQEVTKPDLSGDKKYSNINSFVKRLSVIVPVFLICLFGMQFIFYGRILKDDTVGTEWQILGDREAYLRLFAPKSDLQKFGVYGYYLTDVFRWVFKIKYTSQILQPASDEEGFVEGGKLSGIMKGNNLLYIVAESFDSFAVSRELTPVLYGLKHGYNFTKENFYNIYEFTDDADRTNNLVRKDYDFNKTENLSGGNNKYNYTYSETEGAAEVLSEDELNKYGLSLTNFYNAQPTNLSEFEFITSALPSYMIENEAMYDGSDPQSIIKALADIHTEVSLADILKKSGVIEKSLYAHMNRGGFYFREDFIGKLGYDEVIFADTEHWLYNNAVNIHLDSEFFKDNIDKVVHKNMTAGNWYSQYLTITTHGGFAGDLVNGDGGHPDNNMYWANHSEEFANYYAFVDAWRKNIETTEKEQYGFEQSRDISLNAPLMTNFYAKVLDTEYAMARIIDGLIQTNQLENTVIVFAADHQSYMNNMDLQYKKVFYENFSVNSSARWQVEAFIWGKCLNFGTNTTPKNLYVDKFTTRTDFMPTVLTMFGISYNNSYFAGHILTDETATACVYSAVGIFNDKYFTLDGRNILSIDNVQCSPIDGIAGKDEDIKKFTAAVLYYMNKRRSIDTKLSQIGGDTEIWRLTSP